MMKFLLAALSLAMVGCASIVNDSSQAVKVETVTADGKAVAGADCKFANDFGASTGKSGDTVQIHRSSKDLDITCASPGKADATGRAISRANAGLAGNILIGGGIGAIIDHNKGTAYTYPTWIKLVFGQMRVFDRKHEKEGNVVTGTLPYEVAGAATAAGITPPSTDVNQAGFIATGFARIDDVDAVPYLGDKGRNAYREWLTKPTPKAFAITSNGWYATSWGLKPQDKTMPTDPLERAIMVCEQGSKQTCKLYAVNGSVVWTKPAGPSSTAAENVPVAAAPTPTAK